MSKTLIFASALAGFGMLAGCANSVATADATHHWQSAEPVSTAQYNRDNTLCLDAANLEDSDLRIESLSFETYRGCMVLRGYTLETN